MLEKYRVGNLREEDVAENKSMNDSSDPFANEPKRHPALNVKTTKPFNAETPLRYIHSNQMKTDIFL